MFVHSILRAGWAGKKNPYSTTLQRCYMLRFAAMLPLVSFSQTTFAAHFSVNNSCAPQGLFLMSAHA